jgi:hypothetical protein
LGFFSVFIPGTSQIPSTFLFLNKHFSSEHQHLQEPLIRFLLLPTINGNHVFPSEAKEETRPREDPHPESDGAPTDGIPVHAKAQGKWEMML